MRLDPYPYTHIHTHTRMPAEVSVRYNADILLAGLIRALEANKQPKSKLSILEFSTACLGRSSTAGIPTSSSMHLK